MSRVFSLLLACLVFLASGSSASALTVSTFAETGGSSPDYYQIETGIGPLDPNLGAQFTLICDLCVLAGPEALAIISDANDVQGTGPQLTYYNANLNLGPALTASDIVQTTTSGTGGGLGPNDQDLDFFSAAAILWFQIDGPEGATIFLHNTTGNPAHITYSGVVGTGAGMSHIVSAVPIPPAMILFASALVAFFGIGRVRRRLPTQLESAKAA